MLKHLYKSHVRESLSPTKIRYNSVNYPIIVQIIRKCSWCTKVYLLEDDYIILYSNWTPLVTLTIRIVRSKVFCEEPAILWSTMRIYWWIYWRIYGSFINGSRKWSPNTRTYVFFIVSSTGLWNPTFRNLYLEFFDVVSHWLSAHLLLRLQYKTT